MSWIGLRSWVASVLSNSTASAQGKNKNVRYGGTQELLQIESFSSFTAYPHCAVHQGSEGEQAGIAVARQFSVMNDQRNFRLQFDPRHHVTQA